MFGARAAMAWEPSEYKKDVTGEMPNAYDPKMVEGCWGEFWEKEGLMGADAEVRLSAADCADGWQKVLTCFPLCAG